MLLLVIDVELYFHFNFSIVRSSNFGHYVQIK